MRIIINIFPYFVIGFISLIIVRNLGDFYFVNYYNQNDNFWIEFVSIVGSSAKIFLSMSMAAVGLSTNLKDIKSMGYKPFIVGFVSLLTVGLVSILSIEFLTNFIS